MPSPRWQIHSSWGRMSHTNSSEYSLASAHGDNPRAPLLGTAPDPYGTTASPDAPRNSSQLLFSAAIRMAAVFVLSTAMLGGILWLALPHLEESDRPLLHIPRSFDDLQAFNGLLKKYRDIYPYRIVICYVVTYLFIQAFSLPGSMYLSILAGAMWGVPRALPLACTCIAMGASLCFLISAAFGPALLTIPKWKARLDNWSLKVASQKENMISFLIVLRIAPLPPHWVVNVICPHIGIGLVPFWVSTWLGMFGITVIHTTIGRGLDEMTSADDFHLISWQNFLLLSAVVVGVLIPVGLRYYFKREISTVADIENSHTEILLSEEGDQIQAAARATHTNKAPVLPFDDEDSDVSFDDGDADEDVILEAGPAIVLKLPEGRDSNQLDSVSCPGTVS